MLIVSTTGATNISDVHEAVAGVFDADADTAAHLLLFPGWRHATEEEAAAFAAASDLAVEPAPPVEEVEPKTAEPKKAAQAKKAAPQPAE